MAKKRAAPILTGSGPLRFVGPRGGERRVRVVQTPSIARASAMSLPVIPPLSCVDSETVIFV